MKGRFWLRISFVSMILAASVLTACTVSATGGLAGIVFTALLAVLLFVGGATQTGCADDVSEEGWDLGSNPDMADDAERDTYVGPCLGRPLDMGEDTKVGPCLQPPPPDMGPDTGDMADDAYIGPCLEPPPPDMEYDANPPADMGGDGGSGDTGKDATITPCLTIEPGDMAAADFEDDRIAAHQSKKSDREEILEKMGDRLPGDVLDRLS